MAYYHIHEAVTFAKVGSVLRRQIPAGPVEEAVIKVIKESLVSSLEVGTLIEEHVKAALVFTDDRRSGQKALEAEEKAISWLRSVLPPWRAMSSLGGLCGRLTGVRLSRSPR